MGAPSEALPEEAPGVEEPLPEASEALPPEEALPPPAEAVYELVSDGAALDDWLAAAVRTGQLALDLATTVPGDHNMWAHIAGIGLAAEAGRELAGFLLRPRQVHRLV